MELKQFYNERTYTFNDFLNSTFGYMFLGLVITAVTAFFGYGIFGRLATSFSGMLILGIIQIGISIYFSSRLFSMEVGAARFCFLIYSFVTGITLSYLPYVYGGGTLAIAVIMTAVAFGSMAIIGHTTHVDMSRVQPYLMAGLIAIIVTTLLNMLLFRSFGLDALLNYAGIIIFLGIIAYDMQNLRQLYNGSAYDDNLRNKLAIYGAFSLYLDFINIFLRVLEIVARNRDDN